MANWLHGVELITFRSHLFLLFTEAAQIAGVCSGCTLILKCCIDFILANSEVLQLVLVAVVDWLAVDEGILPLHDLLLRFAPKYDQERAEQHEETNKKDNNRTLKAVPICKLAIFPNYVGGLTRWLNLKLVGGAGLAKKAAQLVQILRRNWVVYCILKLERAIESFLVNKAHKNRARRNEIFLFLLHQFVDLFI